MLGQSPQIELKAARTRDGLHNSDGGSRLLQHLALLNVQLQIAGQPGNPGRVQAVAPALKDGLQRLSPSGHKPGHPLPVQLLGDQPAADGAAAEVAGLLTAEGPHPHGDGQALLPGPPQNHQARDHAGHTVVAPAVNHRVQVGTDQVILTVGRRTAGLIGGVGVAHLVLEALAAQISAQKRKNLVHLVLCLCISKPGHTAAGQAAHIVKAIKQLLAVLDVSKWMIHKK